MVKSAIIDIFNNANDKMKGSDEPTDNYHLNLQLHSAL